MNENEEIQITAWAQKEEINKVLTDETASTENEKIQISHINEQILSTRWHSENEPVQSDELPVNNFEYSITDRISIDCSPLLFYTLSKHSKWYAYMIWNILHALSASSKKN